MLTYEQALSQVLQASARCSRQVEKVALADAFGRVLAGAITAGFDLPRFNNSAVDGYGVLVEDLLGAGADTPVTLKLKGQIAAGGADGDDLKPGECLRILTGAPVPDSVEAVVMKEYCRLSDEDGSATVTVATGTRIGENIRMRGEEIEAGSQVLGPGMLISPPIVGLLATLGQTDVDVFKQPSVAVIATGDELVDPGTPLSGSQIYNSNSPALLAALRALGLKNVSNFHTRDDEEETRSVLQNALENFDVIISIGGVSVGERDFVKGTFESLNVQTVFWRIAIKPGKPVYFGTTEEQSSGAVSKLIFGLPGNPVSALVTFNLFVKPALKIMQGLSEKEQRITTARLKRNLKKKAGRLDFVRGTLESGEDGALVAQATSGQESHMLTGLAQADCLMLFDSDLEFLPEGAAIPVQLINWHE
ncbi:MAG: molybdopterin molybdotransferase MoeA [Cyanobacteria bacterium SZAS LIN-2]|nr:molybdopterin molybdotransferase MoeA [Cyanobacteria bacterium SZAS LIN-2]